MNEFKCYRCMHCCFFTTPNEYPIVTEPEVERLKELSKRFNVKLLFKHLGGIFYLWIISGFCPFYDVSSSSCRIHDKKPASCSMFPLLVNIKTGEVHLSFICDWVQANVRRDSVAPQRVIHAFSKELEIAVKLYNYVLSNKGGQVINEQAVKER